MNIKDLTKDMTYEQLLEVRRQLDALLAERKATRGRRVLRVSYRPSTAAGEYEVWQRSKLGANVPSY